MLRYLWMLSSLFIINWDVSTFLVNCPLKSLSFYFLGDYITPLYKFACTYSSFIQHWYKSLLSQIWLCGSHDSCHQTMTKLSHPWHRKVYTHPYTWVTIESQHFYGTIWKDSFRFQAWSCYSLTSKRQAQLNGLW